MIFGKDFTTNKNQKKVFTNTIKVLVSHMPHIDDSVKKSVADKLEGSLEYGDLKNLQKEIFNIILEYEDSQEKFEKLAAKNISNLAKLFNLLTGEKRDTMTEQIMNIANSFSGIDDLKKIDDIILSMNLSELEITTIRRDLSETFYAALSMNLPDQFVTEDIKRYNDNLAALFGRLLKEPDDLVKIGIRQKLYLLGGRKRELEFGLMQGVKDKFTVAVDAMLSAIHTLEISDGDISENLDDQINAIKNAKDMSSIESVSTKLIAIAVSIKQQSDVFKERVKNLNKELENSKKSVEKLTEVLKASEKIATTDLLTGALTRMAIFKHISDNIELSKRHNFPVSMLFLDIDNFKSVNDNYGHKAGDVVLKKIVESAINNIRKSDKFARFGGEEFLILMPHADLKAALVVAEKVRRNIESLQFQVNEKKFSVTISIGLARLDSSDDTNILIEKADKAMYKSKKSGKNKIST